MTADLTPYANKTVQLRFRYWTDGAAVGDGFSVDDIAITGLPTDGAETDTGWTYDGFIRTTGTEVRVLPQRLHRRVPPVLRLRRVAPRSAVQLRLPQPRTGWSTSRTRTACWSGTGTPSRTTTTSATIPGEGLILPVDAHPALLHWSDGSVARPRIQSYDSTFGLEKTDAITLHNNSVATTIPSQPAVPVFDDLVNYWTATDPKDDRWKASWSSVIVPKTGMQIRVKSETKGGFNQIEVSPSN